MKRMIIVLAVLSLSGCKLYSGDNPVGWHFSELRESFAEECDGVVTDNSSISDGQISLDIKCSTT